MRFFVSILFSVLFTSILTAQTLKDAESLFQEGKYEESSQIYRELLAQKPNDANLNLRLGRTLLMQQLPQEALPYLQLAKNKRLPRAERYLGECYYLLYRFDEAVTAFENYKPYAKEESDILLLEEQIRKAEMGIQLLERVEDVAIIDSFILPDTAFLDVYNLSREYGEVLSLKTLFGEGFPDNQYAYQSGRKDRIIVSYINDSSEQTDLMISYRLADDWTKAVLLPGSINSEASENYPFMMPDGVMLYFASKGHQGLGGYDIFVSRYNSTTDAFSQPQNVGMPFNSPYNDYLLVIDEMAQVGWFVTDRFQPKGQVVVYKFVPNNEKILLTDLTEDEILKRAQLKSVRSADKRSLEDKDVASSQRIESAADSIHFIVYDALIYLHMNQFVSPEAKKLYKEAQKAVQRQKTLNILLEGKRRELYLSNDAEDKAHLSEAIVGLESEIQQYRSQEQDYIVKARRLEQEAVLNKK